MERKSGSLDFNLPWLVKANGQLLGPFTLDELKTRLESKEIVLLDEVALPMQRWHYLRDEPQLASVVEELRRGAYAGREDTSAVEAGTQSVTDELTNDLSEFSRTEELDPEQNIMDAEFTEKVDLNPNASADKAVPSFGFGGDRNVQRKVRGSTWFFWPATLTLVVGLATLFYFKRPHSLANSNPLKFDELIRKGVDAKRIGDFSGALKDFKRAAAIKPDDPDVNLLLAPLMIVQEGQTVEGKRLLQKVMAGHPAPEEVSQAKTAIGLASLIDGNLDEANRAFTDALSAQNDFYPALANLGSLSYLRGSYRRAHEYYQSAIQENPQDPSLILMMARSELASAMKKQNKDHPMLSEVEDTLRPALQFYDYRSQAYLMMAYVQMVSGEQQDAIQSVDTLLDLDPQLTENHVHEILVYRHSISWEELLPFCEKLSSTYSHYPHMKALEALCHFKANERVEAKKMFEDAILQSPKDTLIRAVYGAVLLEMGQDKEAMASMNSISGDSSYQLPQIMRARLCEVQNDLTCAEHVWNALLKMNNQSLEAMAGLGRVWLSKHQYKQAQDISASGLQLSATYAPLIRIQDAAHNAKE